MDPESFSLLTEIGGNNKIPNRSIMILILVGEIDTNLLPLDLSEEITFKLNHESEAFRASDLLVTALFFE